MPDQNDAALDFLLTRRSRPAKTLSAPAPDKDTLLTMLTAAARTPGVRAAAVSYTHLTLPTNREV